MTTFFKEYTMLKTSKTLGIIGGGLALLTALTLIVLSVMILYSVSYTALEKNYGDRQQWERQYPDDVHPESIGTGRFVGAMFIGVAVVLLASGLLGIIGASQANKSRKTAGILMIIGSILSLITVIGFISFVLLVLGGIFALAKYPSAQTPSAKKDDDFGGEFG